MQVIALTVLAAAVAVVAWLGLRRFQLRGETREAVLADGYQEATVTIDGRYRPDTIRVRQGVLVRLHFRRMEDDPCSERVVFSAFGVERRLPAFQETTVEFMPTERGTFLFTCQWGMYRGRLVVIGPRRVAKMAQAITSRRDRGGDR